MPIRRYSYAVEVTCTGAGNTLAFDADETTPMDELVIENPGGQTTTGNVTITTSNGSFTLYSGMWKVFRGVAPSDFSVSGASGIVIQMTGQAGGA